MFVTKHQFLPNFVVFQHFGSIVDYIPNVIFDNCGQIRIPHKILHKNELTIVEIIGCKSKGYTVESTGFSMRSV